MSAAPFNTDSLRNIDEISGYSKCLNSLMVEILSNDILDPKKRFIDPILLIEKISQTAGKLSLIVKEQANSFSKN